MESPQLLTSQRHFLSHVPEDLSADDVGPEGDVISTGSLHQGGQIDTFQQPPKSFYAGQKKPQPKPNPATWRRF